MSTSDKLVAVGGVLVGLGGALGVAYYIYSLEAAVTFWSWPGLAAVAVTGIGLLVLLIGFFRREAGVKGQRQSGGSGSTNYQAGRDLTIGRGDADQ